MNEEAHKEIRIAKWRDRFFAWIIDFVIVWTAIFIVYSVLGATMLHGQTNHLTGSMNFAHFESVWSMHGFWLGSGTSFTFFMYWGILEGLKGQSLGKRILGIKTVNIDGTPIKVWQGFVNSFGKSFMLAIDMILGLIFTRNRRQRIFNRLSNSIVVKLEPSGQPDVSYKMD